MTSSNRPPDFTVLDNEKDGDDNSRNKKKNDKKKNDKKKNDKKKNDKKPAGIGHAPPPQKDNIFPFDKIDDDDDNDDDDFDDADDDFYNGYDYNDDKDDEEAAGASSKQQKSNSRNEKKNGKKPAGKGHAPRPQKDKIFPFDKIDNTDDDGDDFDDDDDDDDGDNDDFDDDGEEAAGASSKQGKSKAPPSAGVKGRWWMERNQGVDATASGSRKSYAMDRKDESSMRFTKRGKPQKPQISSRDTRKREEYGRGAGGSSAPRQRQDYQGNRVFVQNIPRDVGWQELKDHFRVAGNVIFASVSQDPTTGESKGQGIVQFETTEMALTAIAIMRDYPLQGQTLYVREDVKRISSSGEAFKSDTSNSNYNKSDNDSNKRSKRTSSSTPSPPNTWTCAHEENADFLSDSDRTKVFSLIKARDEARRRRNYEASDSIREELKSKFNVYLDDRLKSWWTSEDSKRVPKAVADKNGDGRWGVKKEEDWRQIPTTPENDACVDPDLVQGLLKQRDIARREKDFKTADALLEQARTAPDGDLYLRIHDESRTWRIWTNDPPPKSLRARLAPAEQCIAMLQEHAPEKVEEVKSLLEKFPGREYAILKKLKQKYLTPKQE